MQSISLVNVVYEQAKGEEKEALKEYFASCLYQDTLNFSFHYASVIKETKQALKQCKDTLDEAKLKAELKEWKQRYKATLALLEALTNGYGTLEQIIYNN